MQIHVEKQLLALPAPDVHLIISFLLAFSLFLTCHFFKTEADVKASYIPCYMIKRVICCVSVRKFRLLTIWEKPRLTLKSHAKIHLNLFYPVIRAHFLDQTDAER